VGIVDEDIIRVKLAANIVEVVQGHVALRKAGVTNWAGLCPFHAERSPSFNVNEKTARYKCFGCGVGGDVIGFVQEIEHVDFVGAVESLAAKYGVSLHYDSNTEGQDRGRKKALFEAVERAVGWYHERLLTAKDAGPARGYLRSRGLDPDTVRRFQIGWAPDDWDVLATNAGIPTDALRETGLGFLNRRQRMQDTFRARVMFPIRNENGEAVGFGGRIMPGSVDPAKYKNSPETPIYMKSKTLYGLSVAKNEIVRADTVVVCEGYTDVIGFHRAGVPNAVATCGTALTEDHVRLLKRFAKNVVLSFDADAAGQGAAERFYEWEKKYDVSVSVARLPDGSDPGDMAGKDPDGLKRAVEKAEPFLKFRLGRVLRSSDVSTNERKARVAEQAMTIVNEHPDPNVRSLYAGEVASHVGLNAEALLDAARKGTHRVRVEAPAPQRSDRETAEVVMLALLVQRWEDTAEWLIEELFADDVTLAAFRALAATNGDLDAALAVADPAARELIERVAVLETAAEPLMESRHLVAAATRRAVDQLIRSGDFSRMGEIAAAKAHLEAIDDQTLGTDSATALLAWLTQLNPAELQHEPQPVSEQDDVSNPEDRTSD
jgi:DNA primase